MTSAEIQERVGTMQEMLNRTHEPESVKFGGVCMWLAEIAYQLAKRNEGPMGARMEKLLRAYVADDPCAPHDPRTEEAVEILAAIDQHERNEAKA